MTGIQNIPELTAARRAMNCEFTITMPAGRRSLVEAACAGLDEIERVEGMLSAYREESELSAVNRLAAERPVAVSPEFFRLLSRAMRIAGATAGAFDPSAGALVRAWGFLRGPRRVPCEQERQSALAASGWRNVQLDAAGGAVAYLQPGLELNLGAFGKGYALDCARKRMQTRSAFLQGGGSSVLAAGFPPREPAGWPVAVGNPCRPSERLGVVRLRDQALGASGAAEQFFVEGGRRYGHILDPRTGWPAHRLLSATAIAPTAAEADALSTAFYVLGLEGTREFLRSRPDAGAILVRPGSRPGRSLEITSLGSVRWEVNR